MKIEDEVEAFVNVIKTDTSVRAIGLSSGDRPFPKAGAGDIDIFVYCTEIPTGTRRFETMSKFHGDINQISVGCLESVHWGKADRCMIAGVETWFLYFTIEEAQTELEDILNLKYPWRIDNYYYPLGRLAMWRTMRVLYDPDEIINSYKSRLKEYPAHLATAIINQHREALADVEDLERAVQREDILFFHFALDLALDHFLQILFALNQTYFPSRKRSDENIRVFHTKPINCEQRLHRVIALGGESKTMKEAFAEWRDLVRGLMELTGL